MVSHTAFRKEQAFREPIERITEEYFEALEHGHLLLSFDRDGTLVPIADHPTAAVIDPEVSTLLGRISMQPNITIAIVSARGIASLKRDFKSPKIILAGNYGMEIQFANGETLVQPQAEKAVARLKEALQTLMLWAGTIDGAIVEDHGYSLCLHWHAVSVDNRPRVQAGMAQINSLFPDLQIRVLPTSYEILPPFDWNKGMALEQIAARIKDPEIPLYCSFAGDSPADEHGFQWVNSQDGMSIRVGSAGAQTCSRFQLSDTTHTRALLDEFIEKVERAKLKRSSHPKSKI